LLPFIIGSEPSQRSSCTAGKSSITDWFQSLFGGDK
jgi:hypothetical protein